MFAFLNKNVFKVWAHMKKFLVVFVMIISITQTSVLNVNMILLELENFNLDVIIFALKDKDTIQILVNVKIVMYLILGINYVKNVSLNTKFGINIFLILEILLFF
jgi:hypothetical protein